MYLDVLETLEETKKIVDPNIKIISILQQKIKFMLIREKAIGQVAKDIIS